MITYKIDLDFNRPDRKNTIVLKKGAVNSVTLELVLHSNGRALDMTDVDMATLKGATASGTIIYGDGTIEEDAEGNAKNKVLYTLPQTATAAAGLTAWELELCKAAVDQTSLPEVITSYTFYTTVENLVYDEEDYLIGNDISGWKNYFLRAQTAAEAAETSAGDASDYAEAAEAAAASATSKVRTATTAEWNAQIDLVAEDGIVYVYTDRYTNPDGDAVPGYKVGDGTAYLIDMPFDDDIMSRHAANTTVHVTEEEKEFWNNKVTAYLDAEDLTNLVLSKN